MSQKRRQWEQRAAEEVNRQQWEGEMDCDNPVQTVSLGSGASQKTRLTLILFQSVEQWFDPEVAVPKAYAQVRDTHRPEFLREPSLHGILIVSSM